MIFFGCRRIQSRLIKEARCKKRPKPPQKTEQPLPLGATGALIAYCIVAVELTIIAAFGMWLKSKLIDVVLGYSNAITVRLIHAKEPGPMFREDFDRKSR